jgi:hypothetical protein
VTSTSDSDGTRHVGPAVALGVAVVADAFAVVLVRVELAVWHDAALPSASVAQRPVPDAFTPVLSELADDPAPVSPRRLRADSEMNPPLAVTVY